jgi:RNA polymerase sigma-70 factor, ECF subfamily
MESESRLIDRARRGSHEAFADLIRAHHAAVCAYIGRFVRGRDVVDDLAQEAFLGAYRGLEGFREEVPFRIWLLGIARRQVAGFLRAEVRRRTRHDGALAVALTQMRVEEIEGGRGDDIVRRDREIAALERCLERLGPRNAVLVEEYYFRERSAVEIGRALGKTDNAVRVSLSRLRRGLLECVKRRLALERH